LKNRMRIARANAGNAGVQTEVPIGSILAGRAFRRGAARQGAQRQDVSLVPRDLPVKHATRKLANAGNSEERADRVLAETVVQLLKSGDSLEAERTAALLEKSYPESELIAETRFQQGLYFFRKKNFNQADRLFQSTLKVSKAHVRAKAGALLMRGIIARHLATEAAASGRSETAIQASLALSRKSFDYVRKYFPGSPEAGRAAREIRSMNSSSSNASRVK
jgi:TolA-binding protein